MSQTDALDMLSTSRYLMRHAVLYDDRDVEWRTRALRQVASWLRLDSTVIGGLGLAIRLTERALASGFPVSRHGMRLAKRALRTVEEILARPAQQGSEVGDAGRT